MASEQIEEYLETIGRLEERGERVSTSYLAKQLKVAPPSVTEMLHRLSERGLLSYEPRGEIALTENGRTLAHSVMRRHRLWERFLHDILGMRADRVHLEACKLEHATSPEVEQRLARVVGDSTVCPHGAAIPPAAGESAAPFGDECAVPCELCQAEENGVALSQLRPGESGIVGSLKSGCSFSGRCLALGFTPGAEVTMVRNFKTGALIVAVRGTRVALGRGEAEKIRIIRSEAGNGAGNRTS